MALIFPRLAQNFIKNGYFPTDEETLSRVLGALDISAARVRIFDPCCGEGSALAEVKRHLTDCGASVAGLGVEFDADRAWHAKGILDRVAHADVADVFVTARSLGLLFLNPPYGHVVADTAGTGDRAKSDRLEKQFLRRTLGWIQFGGVMVLIVPSYVLDMEFASLIARNFERVEVFMAPEQQFKQCVIFGVKRRSDTPDPAVVKRLALVGSGTLPPTLPESWTQEPYLIPQASDDADFSFHSIRLDAEQLRVELKRMNKATLWPQFGSTFSSAVRMSRRPLRDLSKWHLALALAAGQINGLVESADGRKLLIKGNTFKEKAVASEYGEGADGSVIETRTATDIFVPVIRGIDLTPGPTFGNIVTIR